MPVCEVCQKEVTVPTTIIKCEQNTEKIRTTHLKQVNGTCNRRKYKYTKVYTGSCPQQQAAKITTIIKFATFGSAVGTLFGSSLLGALIGGAVGAIGLLFSKCSRTYASIKTPYNIQEQCIKLIRVSEVVTRPYSVCLDHNIEVKTGFGIPETCNCLEKECVVKIENQQCIKDNLNCRKERKFFLQTKVPKDFIDLMSSIQQIQEEVDKNNVVVERWKFKKDYERQKLNEMTNLIMVDKQEATFANKTKDNFKINSEKELCQADIYKRNLKLFNVIQIVRIDFKAYMPIINNIPLKVTIKYLDNNKIKIIPVAYNLNDEATNMKEAAEILIRDAVCPELHQRKRRSTSETLSKSIQRAQELCLASRHSLVFLNKTTERLIEMVRKAALIKTKEKDLAFSTSESKVSSVILEQNKLVVDVTQSIDDFMKTKNLQSIASQVTTYMELFSALQTDTTCATIIDCLEDAFETLEKLPLMTKHDQHDFKNTLPSVKNMLMEKFLTNSWANTTIERFIEEIEHLQNYLKYVKGSQYHCSEKPKISKQPPSIVDVRKGEIKSLYCHVKSDVPIQILWLKDNKVIDGEEDWILNINTSSVTLSGSYKCLGISQVGNTESHEVFVDIYDTPQVISQPQDIDFILPQDGIPPVFTFNTTASPEPKYQWFYYETLQDLGKLIPGENTADLVLKKCNPPKCRLLLV